MYKKAESNPPKDLKKVTSFSINPSLESLYFTARDARDWGEMDTTIVWHCSPLPTYRERERRRDERGGRRQEWNERDKMLQERAKYQALSTPKCVYNLLLRAETF